MKLLLLATLLFSQASLAQYSAPRENVPVEPVNPRESEVTSITSPMARLTFDCLYVYKSHSTKFSALDVNSIKSEQYRGAVFATAYTMQPTANRGTVLYSLHDREPLGTNMEALLVGSRVRKSYELTSIKEGRLHRVSVEHLSHTIFKFTFANQNSEGRETKSSEQTCILRMVK